MTTLVSSSPGNGELMTRPEALTRITLGSAVDTLGRRDRRLGRIVACYGAPPLWARRPGFATLLRIILEQQVSLDSARAVYRRLTDALPEVTPASVLRVGAAGLQRLGCTRQKASYACRLAHQILEGELSLSRLGCYPDELACERLMCVTGIGPWTASIYLLMALRRPDVWPPGDLALQKAVARLVGSERLPLATEAERLAERWRPLRAVAARILWHGYLSERACRMAMKPCRV